MLVGATDKGSPQAACVAADSGAGCCVCLCRAASCGACWGSVREGWAGVLVCRMDKGSPPAVVAARPQPARAAARLGHVPGPGSLTMALRRAGSPAHPQRFGIGIAQQAARKRNPMNDNDIANHDVIERRCRFCNTSIMPCASSSANEFRVGNNPYARRAA